VAEREDCRVCSGDCIGVCAVHGIKPLTARGQFRSEPGKCPFKDCGQPAIATADLPHPDTGTTPVNVCTKHAEAQRYSHGYPITNITRWQFVMVRSTNVPSLQMSIHRWIVMELGVWSGWEVIPGLTHHRFPWKDD
jgi:hypothetical protein